MFLLIWRFSFAVEYSCSTYVQNCGSGLTLKFICKEKLFSFNISRYYVLRFLHWKDCSIYNAFVLYSLVWPWMYENIHGLTHFVKSCPILLLCQLNEFNYILNWIISSDNYCWFFLVLIWQNIPVSSNLPVVIPKLTLFNSFRNFIAWIDFYFCDAIDLPTEVAAVTVWACLWPVFGFAYYVPQNWIPCCDVMQLKTEACPRTFNHSYSLCMRIRMDKNKFPLATRRTFFYISGG